MPTAIYFYKYIAVGTTTDRHRERKGWEDWESWENWENWECWERWESRENWENWEDWESWESWENLEDWESWESWEDWECPFLIWLSGRLAAGRGVGDFPAAGVSVRACRRSGW